MKSIKETEMLMNLAKALGQEVDDTTLKQAQKIISLKREVLESVRSNILTDLAKASKQPTAPTPPTPVIEEGIVEPIPIEYPVPPSLDDIAHLISDEELVQEVVEEIETAKEETLADLAAKFIGESKDSFQQPEIEEVPQDLSKIIQKLKYLEQWLGKISIAGTGGGGAGWLYDLGDTEYSSVKNGRNNGILTFRSSDRKWVSENRVITDNVYANYYEVNVNANHAVSLGQMAWNPQALTFDIGLTNGMVLQVGQETVMRVKASGAIAKGDAVMFAGASGENILAAKNDPTVPNYIPEWFIGVAPFAISNNGFGYITIYGLVEGLNITYDAGTILYTNPSVPGGLTSTQPLPPNDVILAAAVTKKSSGDGHIMVRPTWRPKLSTLSDVEHNNPTTGDVLYYNGNSWTHTNSLIGINVTSNLNVTGNAVINNLVVSGNLLVNGDVTTFNTATLSVEDKNVVLANGAINSAASDGAGISISGSYANLTYYSTPNRFNLNRYLDVLGNTVLTNANTTTHLTEGNNLYFTNARVYANVILLDYANTNTTNTISNNLATAWNTANSAFNKANIVPTQLINGSDILSLDGSNKVNLPGNTAYIFSATNNITLSPDASGDNSFELINNVGASLRTDRDFEIRTNTGGTNRTWTFTLGGSLFFPDSTFQTTAFSNTYLSTRLATKANVSDLTTANISELTNLYYTNARVYDNVITLGYATNAYVNTRLETKANVGDLTTSNIVEGSNLYYTNARVYANVILLGYANTNTTNTLVNNLSIAWNTANSAFNKANTSFTVNGTSIFLGNTVTITSNAETLTGTSLNSTILNSNLNSVGILSTLEVANNITIGDSILSSGTTGGLFPLGTTNIVIGPPDGNTNIRNNLIIGSGKTITTSGAITANATTAFKAGDAAISGVALEIPREGGIRNMYNGDNTMYFDVSNGGSTHGHFSFRGSSAFTQYAKIDNSGIDAISSYKGKAPFNSALDTVVTVDNLKYRISNQGGVFPQVASASGSTVDVAYSAVGYINGTTNPATAHNSGYILAADGTWLSLFSAHGMDDRGDYIVFHIVDKGAGKIYRVTYMVTNNSSNTTGYNILVERII